MSTNLDILCVEVGAAADPEIEEEWVHSVLPPASPQAGAKSLA